MSLLRRTTYTYGPTGNILTSPAGTYSYAGSSGSSYTNPHASTNVGLRSFAYDPAGNLLSDVGGPIPITNIWNYRNELATTLINIPGSRKSITYGYDASGQRISLRERTVSNTLNNVQGELSWGVGAKIARGPRFHALECATDTRFELGYTKWAGVYAGAQISISLTAV